MSAGKLLDRLNKVRQTAPDRWIACCPAHEDHSPSLSVRELSCGTVLLKCFSGCGAADVVEAVGLQMSDLFPERPADNRYRPSGSRVPARDLLLLIERETMVVAVIASDFLSQRVMDEGTWTRLAAAANRIGRARDHVS